MLFRATRRVLALTDAVAILLFATIGLISHDKGLSAGGYARDWLPLLAGWYGAALLFHLYSRPRLRALLETWLVGITTGVLLRALVLGRSLNGKEAAFLVVSLVMSLIFVGALRIGVGLLRGVARNVIEIPASARAVIESGALAHLVTLGQSGAPQVSCVWVASTATRSSART